MKKIFAVFLAALPFLLIPFFPAVSAATCGNHSCESGETYLNCTWDCSPVCGNGYCESGESAIQGSGTYCPQDCKITQCQDSQANDNPLSAYNSASIFVYQKVYQPSVSGPQAELKWSGYMQLNDYCGADPPGAQVPYSYEGNVVIKRECNPFPAGGNEVRQSGFEVKERKYSCPVGCRQGECKPVCGDYICEAAEKADGWPSMRCARHCGPFTLTVIGGATGCSVAGGTSDPNSLLPMGTVSDIIASCILGGFYHFDYWENVDGLCPINNPNSAGTSIVVNGNCIVTAYFSQGGQQSYSLSVSASPSAGGSVSGAASNVSAGSVKSVSASAASGYGFSNWSVLGSCAVASSSSASTAVTVNGNCTVTANFSVSPSGCTLGAVRCSGNNRQQCRILNGNKQWVTVEACANGCANNVCKPAPVCGNSVCETGETVSSCPVDCARYTLTTARSPSSGGTVSGSVSNLPPGSVKSVSASAVSGYGFSNWSVSGSCTVASSSSASTAVTVNGNCTVTANFSAFCSDACPIANSYQCSGNDLQQCKAGANGCKAWTLSQTCSKGCANAQCKTCTDACTPGTSYCLNGNLKGCLLQPDSGCYAEIGVVCPLGCANGACISSVCGNNVCEEGETQANCSQDCAGALLTITSPGSTEDLSDGIQITATVSQAAKYFEFVLTPLNYQYPGYTHRVSRVNATTSLSETIPRSAVFSRGFPAIGAYSFKSRACKTRLSNGSTFSDCGPWSEKALQLYYAAPTLLGPANGSTVSINDISKGIRMQAQFPYPDGIPAQNTLKIHFNLSWEEGSQQSWRVSCSLVGSSLYGNCYASIPIPQPPAGMSSANAKWWAEGQLIYLSLGKLTTFGTNSSPKNNFNLKGAPKPKAPTLNDASNQKAFCDKWWPICKSNLISSTCKNLKVSERCKNTG